MRPGEMQGVNQLVVNERGEQRPADAFDGLGPELQAPRFRSSALTGNTALFLTVVILLDFVNSDASSSASQVCFFVGVGPTPQLMLNSSCDGPGTLAGHGN